MQNKDMNETDDAHAYEMQCNYGSQTPKVLHVVCAKRTIGLEIILGAPNDTLR
jgi:hypothetical protein